MYHLSGRPAARRAVRRRERRQTRRVRRFGRLTERVAQHLKETLQINSSHSTRATKIYFSHFPLIRVECEELFLECEELFCKANINSLK